MSSDEIKFKLFEKGDSEIYNSFYRIDPIVIPLLLSLMEQLSKFHNKKLSLLLFNNVATIEVLEFLYKCNFFFILGDNKNPSFPKGKNISDFDEHYFGAFKGKKLRDEHRVRSYSLSDDGLSDVLREYPDDDQKRDFLISHYTYKVRDHFQELLFDNESTAYLHNTYIDILSELITNAVLHSGSNAYALMFVNKFKTKFSISDNGVGFEGSMKTKTPTSYYKPNSLKRALQEVSKIDSISTKVLDNLHLIFETLYYSSLKDRHGLFDLMVNVVLRGFGYFRIHTENSQIIISHRMIDELTNLDDIRSKIYNLHTRFQLSQIDKKFLEDELQKYSALMKEIFVSFYQKAIAKYSDDIKFSSLRFYKVKFRGVHIEVEIPNASFHDSI